MVSKCRLPWLDLNEAVSYAPLKSAMRQVSFSTSSSYPRCFLLCVFARTTQHNRDLRIRNLAMPTVVIYPWHSRVAEIDTQQVSVEARKNNCQKNTMLFPFGGSLEKESILSFAKYRYFWNALPALGAVFLSITKQLIWNSVKRGRKCLLPVENKNWCGWEKDTAVCDKSSSTDRQPRVLNRSRVTSFNWDQL